MESQHFTSHVTARKLEIENLLAVLVYGHIITILRLSNVMFVSRRMSGQYWQLFDAVLPLCESVVTELTENHWNTC